MMPLLALVLQLRNPGPRAQHLLWQVVSQPASPWGANSQMAGTLCPFDLLNWLCDYLQKWLSVRGSFRLVAGHAQWEVYRHLGYGRPPVPTMGCPFHPHYNPVK